MTWTGRDKSQSSFYCVNRECSLKIYLSKHENRHEVSPMDCLDHGEKIFSVFSVCDMTAVMDMMIIIIV